MAHDLKGKNVSGDEVIKKIIGAEAKLKKLQREAAALRKDRDDLLGEFEDFRKTCKIATFVPSKKRNTDGGFTRISFGDVHGMRMDRKAVEALLNDILLWMPDEIIIGGDLVDCGGWLAKKHALGYVAYSNYSYQDDIAAANWLLDELATAVPNARVHYIEGNHEDRVERYIVDEVQASQRDADFLRNLIAPDRLLRLEERNIKFYRRAEVYGDGLPRGWIQLGKMYFTHTLGTGKNAAMSAVTKTAGYVRYFCTHREDTATVVLPAVGLCKADNPGCLCEMQPMWRNSDPTNWSQGYAVDFVSADGNMQTIHVPIWRGNSLASAMIEKFRN
jgi:hypothetical protein